MRSRFQDRISHAVDPGSHRLKDGLGFVPSSVLANVEGPFLAVPKPISPNKDSIVPVKGPMITSKDLESQFYVKKSREEFVKGASVSSIEKAA